MFLVDFIYLFIFYYCYVNFQLSRFWWIKMVFSPLSLVGTKLPDEPLRWNFSRRIPTHGFNLIFIYIYIYIYIYSYTCTYICVVYVIFIYIYIYLYIMFIYYLVKYQLLWRINAKFCFCVYMIWKQIVFKWIFLPLDKKKKVDNFV